MQSNTSSVSHRPRVVLWVAVVALFAIPGSLEVVFRAGGAEISAPSFSGVDGSRDSSRAGDLSSLGLASADKDWAPDEDGDAFSDEMESVFGSNPFESDTDFDGFDDGLEFTLGSDPKDPRSTPVLYPSTHMHVREVNGMLRVFVGVYPANPHLVDGFEIHLASPEFDVGYGNDYYRVFNFTPALSDAIESFSHATDRGLSVLTFTFELPSKVLDDASPLTVGLASKLANVVSVFEVDLMVLTNGTRVVSSMLDLNEMSGPGLTAFGMLPLDAQFGGGGEPEYCELKVDGGTPVGLAGISYTIEDADCEPAGLTLCVQEECETMLGREILEIDRGFLQDRMD